MPDKDTKKQTMEGWIELQGLINGKDEMSVEDYDLQMADILSRFPNLQNDPNFIKWGQEIARIKPGIAAKGQVLADMYDYIVGSKDVKLSDQERKKLRPPTIPGSPNQRGIKNRIGEARSMASTAGAATQAAINRAAADSYMQDLTNAKVASTGQASTYGSYAQAASNRKARNKIAGQPMVRQAVLAEEARVDGLVNSQEQLAVAKNRNELMAAQMAQRRYEMDRKYVDALGRRGRQTRRNAIHNVVQPLAELGARSIANSTGDGLDLSRGEMSKRQGRNYLENVSPPTSVEQIERMAGVMPEEVAETPWGGNLPENYELGGTRFDVPVPPPAYSVADFGSADSPESAIQQFDERNGTGDAMYDMTGFSKGIEIPLSTRLEWTPMTDPQVDPNYIKLR